MNGSPTSRLERRKARTRASITEAASALFHDQGFDATSIQEVAERADTGVGTVYGYFASKEDVLMAVVRGDSEDALAGYRSQAAAATSWMARLLLAIDVFAAHVRLHRPVLEAAVRIRGGKIVPSDTPGWWVYEAFRGLIQAGVDSGEFRPVPVATTARLIVSTYMMAMLGFGLWAGQEDDPTMVDELRSLLTTALTPDA